MMSRPRETSPHTLERSTEGLWPTGILLEHLSLDPQEPIVWNSTYSVSLSDGLRIPPKRVKHRVIVQEVLKIGNVLWPHATAMFTKYIEKIIAASIQYVLLPLSAINYYLKLQGNVFFILFWSYQKLTNGFSFPLGPCLQQKCWCITYDAKM